MERASSLDEAATTVVAASSPTRPAHVGYATAACIIFLGFFTSVAPTPLYQIYAEQWRFSAVTLTLIYATYAVGVLAALLLAGGSSDDVGRRPVLAVAVTGLMLSCVVFVLASSTAWLFVARGLGGLATGLAISSASAVLLDLQPRRDARVVAVTNGVASNAGLGMGILVVSALVQAGWSPRFVPFAVLFLLLALALAGVWSMPEPVMSQGRLRVRVERPYVPAVARRPFVVAGLVVLSSWSIAGLFFSIGPQLGVVVFHTSNAVVADIGIFALLGTAALAQLVFGRATPWVGATVGSVALALGMVVIVIATAAASGAGYLAGSIVTGLGFGIAFLGGLRGLVSAIPPQDRAGVMSAFYVLAYASLSVPAVLAGLLVGRLGLQMTFEVFGSAAAVLALFVAFGAWWTRPAAARLRDVTR